MAFVVGSVFSTIREYGDGEGSEEVLEEEGRMEPAVEGGVA